MNTYQGSVGRPAMPVAGGPAAGPLKRPATLAAATWLALATGVLARNGSTGLRVGLTIVLVASLGAISGLQLGDRQALPSATVVLAAVVPLLSIVTIVLIFLPATSKYAKARKQA